MKSDLIIIGAGPGGYETALLAAERGKSVVLVNGGQLGGTCLNAGCIPTKCMVKDAAVVSTCRNSDEFGVKEVKFETYASLRIRGAILDQIRKMDWIPRTIRQKQKKIDVAMKEIEQNKGRAATDGEIAASLGISEEEYQTWQSQMKITGIVSLNEFMESGSEIPAEQSNQHRFEGPEEVVEKEELKKVLTQALELLTEKEKKVILLYYYEDLTLKEISYVLEVSESRISQLHTRALQKMRSKMGNYMGILTT